MRSILFTAPCQAELVEEAIPKPQRDGITVKLLRSSVSAGTERANLTGSDTVSYSTGPSVVFPRRGGYSSTGIVTEIGDDVTDVKVGDRVACSWSNHSEYCKIRKNAYYRIDENISDEAGALVHIATFPLAAIRKCRLEIGESAIVMGLGVLGLIAIELLRASGAAPIIAVDPVESKRKRAIELGADFALDPFANGFADEVKRLTGGGANVAIEVTGKGQGLDMALDCMTRFGRVALLGCTRSSDFSIDYYRKVHGPGITLIGAHTNARPKENSSGGWWTEKDDAEAIIKLIKHGRLDLGRLVDEVHSPNEFKEIYGRLATEVSFPVVQFDWTLI